MAKRSLPHAPLWPATDAALDKTRFGEKAGTHFGWRMATPSSREDPETEDWQRRPDDPNVQRRLQWLRANNGIAGLEIVSPHEIERAATLFHRDGS